MCKDPIFKKKHETYNVQNKNSWITPYEIRKYSDISQFIFKFSL